MKRCSANWQCAFFMHWSSVYFTKWYRLYTYFVCSATHTHRTSVCQPCPVAVHLSSYCRILQLTLLTHSFGSMLTALHSTFKRITSLHLLFFFPCTWKCSDTAEESRRIIYQDQNLSVESGRCKIFTALPWSICGQGLFRYYYPFGWRRLRWGSGLKKIGLSSRGLTEARGPF